VDSNLKVKRSGILGSRHYNGTVKRIAQRLIKFIVSVGQGKNLASKEISIRWHNKIIY